MASPSISEVAAFFTLFAVLFGLVAGLYTVRKASLPSQDVPELDTEFVQRETPAMRARRRRGGLARMRYAVDSYDEEATSESSAAPAPAPVARRSTKKEAKREAKREARAAHLALLETIREQEIKRGEDRDDAIAIEEEEARKAEERQRKLAEAKEKQETEEYENWKDLISVEDAGEGAELEKDDPNVLQRFCDYVKCHKIVVLEELAAEFSLRTEDAVDRLTKLEHHGELPGFFDDRGKFIYVSLQEMRNVATYIKKKGRISIHELASESTSLLHLDSSDSSDTS